MTVVESPYFGNATYVFTLGWALLSQLTKAEILSSDLQEDRIVHATGTWDAKFAELLG